MRRNTYVRLSCYFNPPRDSTVPLADLARSARATGVIEGRLLADVRCREGIKLRADYRNGRTIAEELTTSTVVRLEAGYALTQHFLVQVLRIPPPRPNSVVPPPSPKSAAPAAEEKTVISRSRYDHLSELMFKQLQELEAPIVQAQVLCRLHEAELTRMRGDVLDPQTDRAITAHDLHADFTLLLAGLRYYYETDDKVRHQRTTDLWLAGHRVHAAIASAITLEATFLQKDGCLALFADVYAKLGRLFAAMNHIGTFRAEEGECGAS